MAVDMFLDLDGIKGESADKTHKGEIDVLAWSWGLSNSGSFHTAAAAARARRTSRTSRSPSTSTRPRGLCCTPAPTASTFAKGKITVRKAGENPLEYLTIDFENMLVSSCQTGGSGGEDRLTENVSLNFAKMKMEYWTQSDKGAKGENGNFSWDIPANVKS